MQPAAQTVNGTTPAVDKRGRGLADWLIHMYRSRSWTGTRPTAEMKLVETLQLGAKRQLMLVVCHGQHYLVGGGPESVDSIVPLNQPGSSQEKRTGRHQ